MAAVDVSAVVVGISEYIGPVIAVGAAFLGIHAIIFGVQRIRESMSLGGSDESDFWAKYNSGEAVEGVDFVTAGSSDGHWHSMTVNGVEKSVWIDHAEEAAADAEEAAEVARIDAMYASAVGNDSKVGY